MIFNRIERFFHRLEIHTGVIPSAAMRGIILEIMVEVLTILAVATKETKRGRLSESQYCHIYLAFLTNTVFRKVFEELSGKYRYRG